MASATPRPSGQLGFITLTLSTAALFLTLRNMPMMASTGLQMVFFNLVTVFAFLIPIALVSAELATAWPGNGVFHWVEEAFGSRWGLVAVWLQWVQSLFGITSILSYIAASLAYAFDPSLSANRDFIVAIILLVYWLATTVNLQGTRMSGLISSVCLIVGVLFPTLFLIVFTAIYLANGNPSHLSIIFAAHSWLPLTNPRHNLVLFLSFIFGVVGIEVSASHAREVRNVQKVYPLAVFSAAILGFVLTLAGGLAVAEVVPGKDLDLVSGAVQAIQILLQKWHQGGLLPVLACMVAMGAAGQVSTWVVGPVKGLWAASRSGNLPSFLQRTNRRGVPYRLLLIQALSMSAVALSFLVASSVDVMFLVLTSAAVSLYCVMYLLLFAAAIRLRYSQPEQPRPYRIPGGRTWGLWVVSGTGFTTAATCLGIGFTPPGQGMDGVTYAIVLLAILVIMVALPLFFYRWGIAKRNASKQTGMSTNG